VLVSRAHPESSVQVGEGFGRSPAERHTTASAGRHFVFERPALDAQEVIASAREVVGQSRSGETEGEVDGPPRVAVPVAMFTRPHCGSGVLDDPRDRVSVMPGQPEAHRDLRVEARRIRTTIGGLGGDVGEVQPVRLGYRRGHRLANGLVLTLDTKTRSVDGNSERSVGRSLSLP
jgi:hypothetical protein